MRRDMREIILASASPRRKEILQKTGIPFIVEESSYEENNGASLEPAEVALRNSIGKAADIAAKHSDALIISADTIVALGRTIFGKPKNRLNAAEMLTRLSGKTHTVITAFTVLDTATGKRISKPVESKVFFRKLSGEEIDAYIKTGEPMDKAGSYGVQGLGAAIVRRIEGDFFNVMGLPLCELVSVLKKFGIKIL
jgi:septum formation protein